MSHQGRLAFDIHIRKRMIQRGYKGITESEVELYTIAGPENFKRTVQSAFDYSYLEVKFLKDEMGLELSTEGFEQICKERRAKNVQKALSDIRSYERENPRGTVTFIPYDAEEMKEKIRKKWADQKLF